MKLASQLMNGLTFGAELVSTGAETLIKLETDEILSPSDASFGEFEIVEATDEERTSLRAAGYDLPDFIPLQDGSPGVPGGSVGGAPPDA